MLAVFFLVAGLELKYELRVGILSKPATAIIPIAAALAGVIIPALIYVCIQRRKRRVPGGLADSSSDKHRFRSRSIGHLWKRASERGANFLAGVGNI